MTSADLQHIRPSLGSISNDIDNRGPTAALNDVAKHRVSKNGPQALPPLMARIIEVLTPRYFGRVRVREALKQADQEMASLITAVNAHGTNAITHASTGLTTVLAPLIKPSSLDDIELRGTRMRKQLSDMKPSALQSLNANLDALLQDTPQKKGVKDPVIAHLAVVVKAQLLKRETDSIGSLAYAFKEASEDPLSQGLRELTGLSRLADEIQNLLIRSELAVEVTHKDGSLGLEPKYAHERGSIPGSRLTLSTVLMAATVANDAAKELTGRANNLVEDAKKTTLSNMPMDRLKALGDAVDWLVQSTQSAPTSDLGILQKKVADQIVLVDKQITEDLDMSSLIRAVNLESQSATQNHSPRFKAALPVLPRLSKNNPDAVKQRGATMFRTIGAMKMGDLQVLNESLDKLLERGMKDAVIAHLAVAVKAELLQREIDKVGHLGRAFKRKEGLSRMHGLRELTKLFKLTDDIRHLLIASEIAVAVRTKDGAIGAEPRYGFGLGSIPGSRLTLTQVEEAGDRSVQAAVALTERAKQLVGLAKSVSLAQVDLDGLLELSEAIEWLMRAEDAASTAALARLQKQVAAEIATVENQITLRVMSTVKQFDINKMTENDLKRLKKKIKAEPHRPKALIDTAQTLDLRLNQFAAKSADPSTKAVGARAAKTPPH